MAMDLGLSRRPSHVHIAGVVLLTLASGWAVVQLATISVDLTPLPFLLVSATAAMMVVRQHAKSTGLSPLVMAVLAFAVIFGLVPLADLAFGQVIVHSPGWTRASWLGWAGLLCLYGGYALGRRLLPPRPTQARFAWRRHRSTAISIALVLVAATPIAFGLARVGGLGEFIDQYGFRPNLLSIDVPVLFAVSMASTAFLLQVGNWMTRPSAGRSLLLFGGWLPVTLFLSASHGARWRAFAVLVTVLAVYHLGIRRLRWPAFGLLVAVVAALFVVAGGFRHSRDVPNIFDPVFQRQYVSSHELGQFRAFVLTLDGVPGRLPFQGGGTILSLIPGAPFPTSGALFTSTFYPELWASGATVPTPLPGELYLNFGVIGIVVGMAIFGASLGLAESYRARRFRSVGTLLLYSYSLLPVAGIVRGELTTFLGFYLVAVIPLLLALPFVEPRVRPGTFR